MNQERLENAEAWGLGLIGAVRGVSEEYIRPNLSAVTAVLGVVALGGALGYVLREKAPESAPEASPDTYGQA